MDMSDKPMPIPGEKGPMTMTMPMPMPGEKGPMTMPGDMGPMTTTMHMTFFWGKDVEVLFSGWPGYDRLGMYLLALFFVFALAVAIEFLSAVPLPFKKGSDRAVAAGLVRTGLHALQVGLAYLVMLAVMSFNLGVLIAAIVGHALGYFVFGSRIFRPTSSSSGVSAEQQNHGPDAALPPMKC